MTASLRVWASGWVGWLFRLCLVGRDERRGFWMIPDPSAFVDGAMASLMTCNEIFCQARKRGTSVKEYCPVISAPTPLNFISLIVI